MRKKTNPPTSLVAKVRSQGIQLHTAVAIVRIQMFLLTAPYCNDALAMVAPSLFRPKRWLLDSEIRMNHK